MVQPRKSVKIFTTAKEYFLITFGLSLYVIGWVTFLIPSEMVGGGVTGVSALINYATGGAENGFPIAYSYFIINSLLLLIALKILGPSFGFKTVYAIIITTLMFKFLPDIIPQKFIADFNAKNTGLIPAVVGGALAGAGIGISFSQGGSTGGTDIIALMINKYRNYSPGRIILYIDIVIIGSSYFLFQDFTKLVYGYVMTGVTSLTIDAFLSGAKQSLQIFIFSKKYEEIADRITKELGRGVTAIPGTGWFTKEDHTVLMVVVRKYEANAIYKLIKEIDRNAFLSVGSVMGVYGQGFETIKTK